MLGMESLQILQCILCKKVFPPFKCCNILKLSLVKNRNILNYKNSVLLCPGLKVDCWKLENGEEWKLLMFIESGTPSQQGYPFSAETQQVMP